MEDLVNTVNETTGIWSVSLCHCTEFAVFGVAPSQEPTPGGGGGVSVVVIAASAGGAGFLLVILIFFLGRWFLFRRRQAVEQRIHAQKATEVEATDAAKIPKVNHCVFLFRVGATCGGPCILVTHHVCGALVFSHPASHACVGASGLWIVDLDH